LDEDRLTPELGRLIDGAKAAARAAVGPGRGVMAAGSAEAPAAAGAVTSRAEGWAVLGIDKRVYAGPRLAAAAGDAAAAGTEPEAAAFAVIGEFGDTLLPAAGWREAAEGTDLELPVVVKYLGRWVLVTLGEIPGA